MTKEDLKSYIRNQKWIAGMIKKYTEQKELAESISSPCLDGMPKAHNKNNYAFEELLDSYSEILIILKNQQEEQNKILTQLNLMKDYPKPYKSILTYMYINGYSLERTADEIHYSYVKTSSMHSIALKEFDKLDEKNKVVKKG